MATVRSFLLLMLACANVLAHDLPNDVRVQGFVRPDGARLHLVMRVPLAAMREADIPLRGPGFLDLARLAASDNPLRTAAMLWLADNIAIYEGEPIGPSTRLAYPELRAVRVSLASDRSFDRYERATASLQSPPVADTLDLYWRDQFLDLWLEYPIRAAAGPFAIEARLARLGLQVVTNLLVISPDGRERAFQLHGDAGLVRLDPRWHHAAWRFLVLGVEHILAGIDHLLFIGCLALPFRRLRPLLVIATAFTIAHSITLAASAYGLAPDALWFAPLVEVLVALSILYIALENIVGVRIERRWVLAFVFGLAHGFAFATALADSLQFAGNHLASAILAFNAGVEIGQILVLVVLVPLAALVFRAVPERIGIIIVSAFIAHTAWHWSIERGGDLRKFAFPALDAAAVASVLRWLMAAILLGALVWLADARVRRWLGVPGADRPHRHTACGK